MTIKEIYDILQAIKKGGENLMNQKLSEEIWMRAILKWKRLHPERLYLDIKRNETIDLEGIGKVKIGSKINRLRTIYKAMQEGKHYGTSKDLTEETINWYEEQGMIWNLKEWQKEVYKKAILKWKRLHPEKEHLDKIGRASCRERV